MPTIITLSLMAVPFPPQGECSLEVDLNRGYCTWGKERSATCVQTIPVFSIIFSKIINAEIIMKLNVVQGLYIVLNSRFSQGREVQSQDTNPDPPYHNYILRIYLKNVGKTM